MIDRLLVLLGVVGVQALAILLALWYDRRFLSVNEVIGVRWRTGGTGMVGIVLVFCRDDKKRAYIGVGRSDNEQADAEWIGAYGARLSFKEASAFFEGLKAEEYSEEGL